MTEGVKRNNLRIKFCDIHTMQTQSELKAKCRSIIDGFMHRDAIRDGDITSWINEVVGQHGDLAVWHAIRAGGFGGSEIGVLVRNFLGHRADHQNSAHDIVEGKLLRRTPSEETGDLRRGHDNEENHAQWFYKKYGARRDEDAFKALSNATGARPWMRYSPDEMALVPTNTPNPALGGAKFARILVDYKAPRQVDEADEVAFQYVAQLHQGALVCAKAGVHLDGLMLSQFSWAGWCLKDDEVPYDPELSKAILQAGDHYWDYVVRGQVPRYITRSRFEDDGKLAAKWMETAQAVAQMRAMAKALGEEADRRLEPLKAELTETRLGDQKLSIGDLNIATAMLVDHEVVAGLLPEDKHGEYVKKGGSPSYSAEKMAAHLRSLGVPLKQFSTTKFDDKKVWDWMLANDQDPEALITEQLRIAPTKALQEQARETVAMTYGERAAGEAANDAGEQDDREGQFTERSAPRSAMA